MENERGQGGTAGGSERTAVNGGRHWCELRGVAGHCYTNYKGQMWMETYLPGGGGATSKYEVMFCPVCGVSRSNKAIESGPTPAPYTQAHYSLAARLVDLIEAKGVDAGGVLRRMIAEELAVAEGRRQR
jgi:hypothetical protein